MSDQTPAYHHEPGEHDEQQHPQQSSRDGSGKNSRWLTVLLVAGVVCAAGWRFWPTGKQPATSVTASSLDQPATAQEGGSPNTPAARPVEHPNLALAESSYRAPDFTAEIKGNTPEQAALNQARRALTDHRPADALSALERVPAEFETDAAYLRAHALFQSKRYAEAAVIFNKLADNAHYGAAAQWYGILAMLPYIERRKAVLMGRVKKIAADNGHAFQREARELAEKIVL